MQSIIACMFWVFLPQSTICVGIPHSEWIWTEVELLFITVRVIVIFSPHEVKVVPW